MQAKRFWRPKLVHIDPDIWRRNRRNNYIERLEKEQLNISISTRILEKIYYNGREHESTYEYDGKKF